MEIMGDEDIPSPPASLREPHQLGLGRAAVVSFRNVRIAALEAALDPADRELDLAIERPPPQ